MVSLDVFGLSVHILTFQLHVKDLNETIRYMYEHKMYQKVMLVLGAALGKGCEGGSGSRAHGAVMGFLTLDWLCLFVFFGKGVLYVSLDVWSPRNNFFVILKLQLLGQNHWQSC